MGIIYPEFNFRSKPSPRKQDKYLQELENLERCVQQHLITYKKQEFDNPKWHTVGHL
jgi:hypothetical protein